MKKYRYFFINDAITINEDINLAFVAVIRILNIELNLFSVLFFFSIYFLS